MLRPWVVLVPTSGQDGTDLLVDVTEEVHVAWGPSRALVLHQKVAHYHLVLPLLWHYKHLYEKKLLISKLTIASIITSVNKLYP